MKNNKGFTLVELLATITIMGILAGIGIAGVSRILNKARTNYYEKLEGNIITAAKSYYNDHRPLLPNDDITERTIKLETLTKNKYLTKVVDYNKKDCDLEKSYVTVTKEDKKYKYTVSLSCPNYNNIK